MIVCHFSPRGWLLYLKHSRLRNCRKVLGYHGSEYVCFITLQFLIPGWFPYLFNTKENQNYDGPLPDQWYFNPSGMKPKQRLEFGKWYCEHAGQRFIMRDELAKYTESDVDILLRCCMLFNDQFHSITGIYPLQDSFTIAQACNKVFRKNHLKENTIGVRQLLMKYHPTYMVRLIFRYFLPMVTGIEIDRV